MNLAACPAESGVPAGDLASKDANGYSAEEAAVVEEQLRALGYL